MSKRRRRISRRKFLVAGGAAAGIGLLTFLGLRDLVNSKPTTNSNSTSSSNSNSNSNSNSSNTSGTTSISSNSNSTSQSVTIQEAFKRIILARTYIVWDTYPNGYWQLPNETPKSIGQYLAALNPTLVSQLINQGVAEDIPAGVVADFNTIQSIVRKSNPNCAFGITIEPKVYASSNQMIAQMQSWEAQIDFQQYDVDHFDYIAITNPSWLPPILDHVHSAGKWIGGNMPQNDMPPPGVDYAVVKDTHSLVGQIPVSWIQAIQSQYPGLPIEFHTENDPEEFTGQACGSSNMPANCTFTNCYSPVQRQQYILNFARNQANYGFNYGYNAWFPTQCKDGLVTDPSYDCTTDLNTASGQSTYQYIQSILPQYNP